MAKPNLPSKLQIDTASSIDKTEFWSDDFPIKAHQMKLFSLLIALILCLVATRFTSVMAADNSDAAATSVKHVNPKQAQELVTARKVVVLDIRTPGEFKQGCIAGATNIDFLAPDFEQKISRLDPNKTYLVHCASGGRSTHSLPLLQKHHFQFIYHLDGGMKAWEKEGLPVQRPQ